MFKMKNRINQRTMKKIYYALVLSKLTYMMMIWTCAKEKYKKQLYTLQNRALKIVYHLPIYYSTTLLYGSTAKEMLSIKTLTKKYLILHVHQCIHNMIHNNTYFEQHTMGRTRATTLRKLKTPRSCTTRYGLDGIIYRAVQEYNLVPASILRLTNIQQFKKRLNLWLRDYTT